MDEALRAPFRDAVEALLDRHDDCCFSLRDEDDTCFALDVSRFLSHHRGSDSRAFYDRFLRTQSISHFLASGGDEGDVGEADHHREQIDMLEESRVVELPDFVSGLVRVAVKKFEGDLNGIPSVSLEHLVGCPRPAGFPSFSREARSFPR